MAAEIALMRAVPQIVRRVWWGDANEVDVAVQIGRNWLDVFAEKEINKVLVVRLVDLVVARLMPELLEEGGVGIRRWRTGMEVSLGPPGVGQKLM
jgi:hypothetical protein